MSISCLVPIAAAALGGLVLQERLGKVLSAIALPWAFFFFWLPVACCGGQGAFEGQRWVVSVSAGNHHILVDGSPPSRLGTDI